MPSNWATAPADPVHPAGSTHVGLTVGIGADAIRVMNPWHGFMQDASDAWWQARLCEGEVWVMERTNAAMSISGTITTAAGQPTPFYGLTYTSDAQVWSCPSTKRALGHGFHSYYQGLRSVNGVCATQILGLPTSDEYKTADGKTRQDFERGALVYDAHGSGAWQIYNAPVGNELAKLKLQIVALQEEVAQLKAAPSSSTISFGSLVTADEIAQAAGQAFSAALVAALEKAASARTSR